MVPNPVLAGTESHAAGTEAHRGVRLTGRQARMVVTPAALPDAGLQPSGYAHQGHRDYIVAAAIRPLATLERLAGQGSGCPLPGPRPAGYASERGQPISGARCAENLSARAAEQVAAFNRCVRSGDWASFADHFTSDATMRFVGVAGRSVHRARPSRPDTPSQPPSDTLTVSRVVSCGDVDELWFAWDKGGTGIMTLRWSAPGRRAHRHVRVTAFVAAAPGETGEVLVYPGWLLASNAPRPPAAMGWSW